MYVSKLSPQYKHFFFHLPFVFNYFELSKYKVFLPLNICCLNILEPYPPMPKSELAKKGKMNVPEEEEPYSDEAEELATSKKKKKDTEKYANEWERVSFTIVFFSQIYPSFYLEKFFYSFL